MAASPQLDGKLPAHRQPPPAVGAGAWGLGMMAASLGIDTERLAEFGQRMASQGITVEPARFFFDSFYAHRCLAQAHATDDLPLQALSREMFDRYQALERRRRDVSTFKRPH